MLKFKYSTIIALCAAVALSALAGPAADAASKKGAAHERGLKVCRKRTGELIIRSRCRQTETSLSASGVGLGLGQIIQGCGSPFADVLTATTAWGVIGGSFDTSNSSSRWTALADLPGLTPVDLTDTTIEIVSETGASSIVRCGRQGDCVSSSSSSSSSNSSQGVSGQGVSGLCTGSASNPTAPQGTICIYPYAVTNATSATASAVPASNLAVGLALTWDATSAGATNMQAVWAFTPALPAGCQQGQGVSSSQVSSPASSAPLSSSSSSSLTSSSSSSSQESSVSSSVPSSSYSSSM